MVLTVLSVERKQMLRKSDTNEQVTTAPVRIAAFDRARTLITLLVLVHHSVVNYTHFGNGDKARWSERLSRRYLRRIGHAGHR